MKAKYNNQNCPAFDPLDLVRATLIPTYSLQGLPRIASLLHSDQFKICVASAPRRNYILTTEQMTPMIVHL